MASSNHRVRNASHPRDPQIEQYFRSLFTYGADGMIDYWREVSLGAIDVIGSQVFGWIELDLERRNAGGIGRERLIDHAVSAAQRDGIDTDAFYRVIAVFTHRWSKDGIPAGEPTWKDDDPMKPYYPFWIDGSADGHGRVAQTPPFDATTVAHEMGHGFGMQHDVAADFRTHYADPCCVMSENNSFLHPLWNAFGPAVCLPHLIQQGWMYSGRVYYDEGGWLADSDGITLPLAQIADPGARANLGIKLAYKRDDNSWDYYIEYVQPTGWNTGLLKPYVFIRRIGTVIRDNFETPIFLGLIEVPATAGARAEFVELQGNVRFIVERFDPAGRILRIEAKKL